MNNKYLIINADDFGMSHEFNVAISDLITNGCISSTSLMANGLKYDEALSHIAQYNLKDIGAHLTLTRDNFNVEKPLIYRSISAKKSLEAPDGGLFTTPAELKNHAVMEDLTAEIESQITRLLQDNVAFTHVDNHMYSIMPRMGLQGYRAFFKAYKRLKLNRTCGVRIPMDYYFADNMNYIWGGRKLRPYLALKMKSLRLFGPDYSFAFPYYANTISEKEQKRDILFSFLSSLREGVTELHVHPCIYSEDLRAYNPYWKNRVHEYEILRELNADDLRTKFGIILTSYRTLLENRMGER